MLPTLILITLAALGFAVLSWVQGSSWPLLVAAELVVVSIVVARIATAAERRGER